MPDPLTCSYYTLTGSPVGTAPRHPLSERVAAARRAGFTGMALSPDELQAAGGDVAELVRIFEREGMAVPELEPLRGWDGEPDEAVEAAERAIFALADAFGAERVNTILFVDPAEVPRAKIVERLAAVCDRAGEHGLTVAFEPRANSPVDSPAAALELLAETGRENCGVTLDAYHFHRAGLTLADLEAVAPERIVAIQLNDLRAEQQGSAVEDALEHRLCPGAGVADLPGWVAGLRRHGVAAPVAVEVIDREFMRLPLPEAAERAAAGARAALI